ncbi:MAG: hypothetical protein R3Y68_08605 [Rikenellaceae bacterium]
MYFSGEIEEQEDVSYIEEENDFLVGTSSVGESLTLSFAEGTRGFFWDDTDNDDSNYFTATEGIVVASRWGSYFTPTTECYASFDVKIAYQTSLTDSLAYVDTVRFGQTDDTYNFAIQDSNEWEGDEVSESSMLASEGYMLYIELEEGGSLSGLVAVSRYETYTYSAFIPGFSSSKRTQFLVVNLGKSTTSTFVTSFIRGVVDTPTDAITYDGLDNIPGVLSYHIFKLTYNSSGAPVISFNATKKTITISAYPDNGVDIDLYFSKSADSTSAATLTINACEIEPNFSAALVDGDDVGISAVGGSSTCLELLSSLRSMYNLLFYTNSITRRIYIEPRSTFYDGGDESKLVDWREEIEYSEDFEIEELGEDNGVSLTLAYSEGNDVVDYYNYKTKIELGTQVLGLQNKVSTDETSVQVSMFAPFVTRNVASVGMELLQEIRETEQMEIDDADVEITSVIGYFAGVGARSAGSDTESYPNYPLLVYQSAEHGVNLGFENITASDGTVEGLRKYYDTNVELYNNGRRLTMMIRLKPQDVESLIYPRDEAHRDLRCPYIVDVGGEVVACFLESISDYNPNSSRATKCVFIVDPSIDIMLPVDESHTYITYNEVEILYNNTKIGY